MNKENASAFGPKESNSIGKESGDAVHVIAPDRIQPEPSLAMSAEIFQKLLNELDNKKRKSTLAELSNNPLIVGVICLLLGALTTAIYTSRQKTSDYSQQDRARQQSFSDELSKASIQKFGEVWERFDENEFAIDSLLSDTEESSQRPPMSNVKRLSEIDRLIREDKIILNRSRFWIGEELYDRAGNYLDLSIKYALNKLMGSATNNLSALLRQREAAKQDILKIRKFFLEEEFRNRISK